MVVFVRVGRRRLRRVGLVVHDGVLVAALGRGGVGAGAAHVGAVRGAALEERLLEVRVGLHVARVCRVRGPQLLVAARGGRRHGPGGVAERRQGGRAVRRLRAALRLVLCAHAHRVTSTLTDASCERSLARTTAAL